MNIRSLFTAVFVAAGCITGACVGTHGALAESGAAEDGDTSRKAGRSLTVVPFLYFTPETRLGGGLITHYAYRGSGQEASSPPSSLTVNAVYTQSNQIITRAVAYNTWKNDRRRSYIDLQFQNYPDRFYGIGNDTSEKDEEPYLRRFLLLHGALVFKVRENIYVGPDLDFQVSGNLDFEPGGLLDSGTVPGSEGTLEVGPGFLFNVDSRDHIYNPTSGANALLYFNLFSRLFGSTYDFTRTIVDVRTYIPVAEGRSLDHVLALQAYANFMTGEVPFHRLALLGGPERMRGYFLGRYRDRQMIELQAEYRMPLFWRLGLAGFIGAGDVGHSLGDFRLSELKFSAGAGLRFLVSPHERINLRLDAAVGKGTSGFYFGIFEAF